MGGLHGSGVVVVTTVGDGGVGLNVVIIVGIPSIITFSYISVKSSIGIVGDCVVVVVVTLSTFKTISGLGVDVGIAEAATVIDKNAIGDADTLLTLL